MPQQQRRQRRARTSLSALYARLRGAAIATGQPQRYDLPHGARIAVMLDGARQLRFSIARKGVLVGEVEEQTFRKHCRVPPIARRIPAEGQKEITDHGATWYQIGFVWPIVIGATESFLDEDAEDAQVAV